MTSYQIGEKVNIKTPAGIVEGEIVNDYRGTNVKQFSVKFNYDGSGYTSITKSFSKKTGKPYGCEWLNRLGVMVLLNNNI